MKQYFTGFFTAVCLTTSVFLFVGANDVELKESMIFKNENGNLIIDGNGIKLWNASGSNILASFGQNENGGMLYLSDQDGKIKIGAKVDGGANGGGSFSAFSPNGVLTANMAGTDNGGNLIMASSKKSDFDIRTAISVTERGDGDIQLWNNKGNTTTIIGALHNENHKGDGFINLFDRYGDFGWSATGKN